MSRCHKNKKFYKRQANIKVRRTTVEIPKGKHYRRIFDYWYID